MEENHNMPEQNGQAEQPSSPISEPQERGPDSAPEAEQTDYAQGDNEMLDQEEQAPLAWDFGGEPAEKKGGSARMFFAVFGAVFGVCVLLLIATLFLGDGGFHFIKTLYNERVVYVREDDGTSGLLTPNEAADTVKRSTVTVSVKTAAGNGIGSGFVYDTKGHICTNYHVIEGAVTGGIQVLLPDGKALTATVVGFDEIADLAVLRVEAEDLVPVSLGSSAELLVGDDVVAVGTPASIDFAGTATFGKVSATNRLLALTDESGNVYRKITVIQTDTSVNPGNSGGPMADMYGRVIGIVVRKILHYGGSSYEGIGFAIPIDGAKVILDAIIEDGAFEGDNPLAEGRSQLGVTGHGGTGGRWYRANADGTITSSPTEAEGYYYMPVDGVYVMNADQGNAKGRLYAGDIILAINGLQMTTIQDVIAEVNRHYAGETVTVTVLRGEQQVDVEVLLSEGPVS